MQRERRMQRERLHEILRLLIGHGLNSSPGQALRLSLQKLVGCPVGIDDDGIDICSGLTSPP